MVVTLHLRRPRVEDAEQALAAHREFLDCPYIDFLIDFNEGESFADWVRRMNGISDGINVPRDWVRGEFLFIEVDGTVVGRLSIRYELNAYLREFEGHIGYAVLSRYRRRGYASFAVRDGLARLHQAGIEMALITCDEDNDASVRVIEAEGGVFERIAESGPVRKRRYLVPTRPRIIGDLMDQ